MKKILATVMYVLALLPVLSPQAGLAQNIDIQNFQNDTRIPPGSKVYLDSMDGFETYLMAAFDRKKVPLVVVTSKDKADFEIAGTWQSQEPAWETILLTGQTGSIQDASISVQSLKTGTVVFAYAVHKVGAVRGRQSTAEACAKHLKQAILNK